MTLMDGLLIFFSILFAYFVIAFYLKKKNFFGRKNISLYGPFIMLKTKKGINFLKKLASKKRFWKAYGSFGVGFCLVTMIIFVAAFVWQSFWLLGISPENKALLPGPEFVLALPGINPIIPFEYLFYIIVAMIVAIIVHEFSHGILTIAGDLKVKSMGLLYLIIPMGAFVEPDEEQMKKTKISKRMRIFAVGPLANFVTFFICLLLFSFIFMSSVHPGAGLTAYKIYEDSPAYDLGIGKGDIITSVNGTDLTKYEDLTERYVSYLIAMNHTYVNDTIEISYIQNQVDYSTEITLADKYAYDGENYSKGKGYLGIFNFVNEEKNLNYLQNPFAANIINRTFFFVALPIMGYYDGYNPIASPFTDAYVIEGPLSVLPADTFWIIVNLIYWIAWINLMVGLFNVLPMIPLDGGFLLNDYIRAVVTKFKKGISEEKLEKIVKNTSLVISLFILFLIIFPFIIKYI